MCPIYKELIHRGFIMTYYRLLDKDYADYILRRIIKVIDYLPNYNKIKKELVNNDIAIFIKDDNIVLYKKDVYSENLTTTFLMEINDYEN